MTISKLFGVAALLALPFSTFACAPASGPTDSEDGATAEEDALSATARAYVTLQRDLKKCAAPKCGGWFAKDINKANPTPRYVSGLDFANANLDEDSIDQVLGAADGEVVLRAKLGPLDSASGTRTLLVYEAYRGLPGTTAATGDLYYATKPRDPQIQCFTAPCNNLTTKKLNTTQTQDITRTDVAFKDRIDNAWLTERAEQEGAIILGNVHSGAQFPGGKEKVLSARNVFLKLPEIQGPCPQFKLAACPSGQTRTYTRDTDRCILPGECVPSGACPQFVPSCNAGFELRSWASAPFGCNAYVCDPAWIYPEEN
ncbi:MAG: DUF6748 domain-containing protein [Polyangiaceae bacterium]